jgi:hypothetical protein
MRALAVIAVASCSSPSRGPSTPALGSRSAPPAPVAACASPEHRAFDFWIGEWDVAIRARETPEASWGEARGTQRVESILGGCAISEMFAADGPGAPWAGRSYSSWQPKRGVWRQTWVDDSGSYLAFTGGSADGVMTLVGEERKTDDGIVQMRMVFSDVTPDSLHWEWQRTTDAWATSIVMMTIDYVRASRSSPADR